jgi:hypothetical protein
MRWLSFHGFFVGALALMFDDARELRLTTPNGVHNFDRIAIPQQGTLMQAAGHDVAVHFYGNTPFAHAQPFKQILYAGVSR